MQVVYSKKKLSSINSNLFPFLTGHTPHTPSILHRLPPRLAQLLPRMIRLVGIVNVVLRTLPVLGDHLIQQMGLLRVDHHMLSQPPLPSRRLFPHVLMTAGHGPNPTAPVEPLEALDDGLDALPLALDHRELDDRSGGLLALDRRD